MRSNRGPLSLHLLFSPVATSVLTLLNWSESRIPDPLLLLVEDDAELARKFKEGREHAPRRRRPVSKSLCQP